MQKNYFGNLMKKQGRAILPPAPIKIKTWGLPHLRHSIVLLPKVLTLKDYDRFRKHYKQLNKFVNKNERIFLLHSFKFYLYISNLNNLPTLSQSFRVSNRQSKKILTGFRFIGVTFAIMNSHHE